MKLSATIITLNEEKNIANAIRSVSFADEIIVVDSNSSDKTCQIAQNLGAKVHHHPFHCHGQQKNHAASLAKGEWILSIDADEEVSDPLKKSILSAISQQNHSMYRINRRTNYCNRWIYHGGWYPDYLLRLYRQGEARWSEPHLHEKLVPVNNKEKIPLLQGHLNHYSFPTVKSQILTNLRYASMAAEDLRKKNKNKSYFLKMIMKPFFKFLECYFLKKGILDGIPGMIIAFNAAHSTFMKYSFAHMDKS
ncbi:MAG: glycosyltransferase family 2 protein [Halobacteriovoraceae bacterium]|nr:glycosyltransferase family 2 protein [Halobacteriovoraceae bacterium]